MLIECQNCGAPLDIKTQVQFVKCNYCGRSNRVASTRTMAEQTPAGWQAPPVWTPPQHFPAPSVAIRYHRRPSAALFVAPLLVLLIGAGAAGAVVWSTSATTVTFNQPRIDLNKPGIPVAPALGKAQAWDGRSTLSCGMNETLEIEGKTANVDGTVIDAAINCTVRIKNCTLKGRSIVNAAINSKIEIENSTLDAELVVIDAAQSARINIDKSSRLISADAGIRLGQASRLTIRNSTIDAKGTAVDIGMAATMNADGARISSKATAIDAAMSAQVTLDGTKVEGKRRIASSARVREN